MKNLEPQEALIRKFFERPNVQLFEGVRGQRTVIANRGWQRKETSIAGHL
jgi:hypothetical protein